MQVTFGAGNEVVRDINATFNASEVSLGDVIDWAAPVLGFEKDRVNIHSNGCIITEGTVTNDSKLVVTTKSNEKG